MNRRRFVKICMGSGMPRNTAVAFAEQLRDYNVPYAEAQNIRFFRTQGNYYVITCRAYGLVELYQSIGRNTNVWGESDLYRHLDKGLIFYV